MSLSGARGERHRVVIIGGGFGGMEAAQRLRRADVDVTVADRHNHLLFQPLIYQVAAGALAWGEVAAPHRHMLKRQANATCSDGRGRPISTSSAVRSCSTAASGWTMTA